MMMMMWNRNERSVAVLAAASVVSVLVGTLSRIVVVAFQPNYHASAPMRVRARSSFQPRSHDRRRLANRPSSLDDVVRSATAGNFDYECDVLVLGGGPSGRAISSLLGQKELDVIIADANFDREFAPNYGAWKDEWESVVARYDSMGVSVEGGQCGRSVDREWEVTDCFFGGSFDIPMEERTRLERPYLRVDRHALREALTSDKYKVVYANHISKAIGVNLYTPSGSLTHDEEGSTILLRQKDGKSVTARSKIIIDTTGHETQLVLRDTRAPAHNSPGFQIAYGCTATIDETNSPDLTRAGPYDKEAMTLFDYRTDHFDGDEIATQKAVTAPTFMYVMPLQGNKVFFEETSLVARPAVSFQECKDRCFRRLEYLGIDVTSVEDEEFCYIPMGGSLPIRDQRVIGLGGAAAMVHPSTGYHLCRMMMGAADMAEAIAQEIGRPSDDINVDRAAATAYDALWSPENIRQRNFAVYGGEFLMSRDVVGLRGFFDGFFRLPLPLWAGFLAGWPGLPNNEKHESWLARLWFGLNFIIRIPLPVAVAMAASIVNYCITEGAPLPQSVTPLLGAPPSYKYQDALEANVGDVAVKMEARNMIAESRVTEILPVAFGEEEEVEEKEPAFQ